MKPRLLQNVRSYDYFYLIDGASIKNIYELQKKVKGMDEISYKYHAKKNDFHNWVKEVHEDKKLAKQLLNALDQKKAASAIKRRIDEVAKSRIPRKKPLKLLKNMVTGSHTRTKVTAGLIGMVLLLSFIGITSKASKITGAATATITSGQSGEVAVLGFAGVMAIIGLLFLALHTIKQKSIFKESK